MKPSLAFTFILCINHFVFVVTEWTVATSTLPITYTVGSGINTGFYNETIFIIGGDPLNPSFQVVSEVFEWNTNTNVLKVIGETIPLYGTGQSLTQNKEILYVIQPNDDQFGVYNMKTKQFTENWRDITIPITVTTFACLLSTNEYLFVIGGSDYQYIKDLQMLDLTIYQWEQSAPSLNTARGAHACVVHSDRLWVFGGYDTDFLLSNERISIPLYGAVWEYIDPLTEAQYGARAVSYGNSIYIIGGCKNTEPYIYVTTVHIFNTVSDTMTTSSDALPHGVFHPAIMVFHNVIYIFGGISQVTDEATDRWMYYPLVANATVTEFSTASPTASTAPSVSPSADPSALPSTDPSVSPSNAPTGHKGIALTSNTMDITTPTIYSTITPSDISKSTSNPITTLNTIYNTVKPLLMLNTTIDSINSQKPNSNKMMFIISVVTIVVAAVVLCILIIVCIQKRRNRKQDKIQKNINIINELNDDAREVEMQRTVEGPRGEALPVHGERGEMCSLCGKVSEEKMVEIKGMYHCSVCLRLNDERVDLDVDKMFDSNTNVTTQTATEGENKTNGATPCDIFDV